VNLRPLKTRLYKIYGRLPRFLRVFLVRRISPSFYVGALCVVRRGDGAILLLRNSYRPAWGLPGGMLQRGEPAEHAVVREIREEVGLDIAVDGPPRVIVDSPARRVDVVFTAHVRDGGDAGEVASASAEVLEVAWFPLGEMPELDRKSVV